MNLASLPIRTKAHVFSVRPDTPAARRLTELGIVPGVPIELTGHAPLGGAIRVRLGGHQLALRSEEADLIEIRVGEAGSETVRSDSPESRTFAA